MATIQEPRLSSPAFPPSPPPSPPRRRYKKHHSDPFLELENIPIVPSPAPASPTTAPEEPQEPLLVRVVLTPLYFTSFLLSLFLINRSDRVRRANSHTSTASSILSYLSPSAWIDPEPYQDPSSSTWERRESSAHVEPNSAIQNARSEGKDVGGKKRREGSWYLHKRIRKIAKLEISDAFEMRGRMIVLILSVFTLLLVAVFLALRWIATKLW
ncbi:hypothetical protein BDV96DRAFT_602371 [Lophiotrema nucula]|uniref:Uncharacterized protein n=1 Tax=Lophiotrema nucula TaxID=690887 RepID=A0A6A5YZC5_9PLEO|nr:hypothetical protein BDV96DRAFT_602371 [Lophiotrema nucula]